MSGRMHPQDLRAIIAAILGNAEPRRAWVDIVAETDGLMEEVERTATRKAMLDLKGSLEAAADALTKAVNEAHGVSIKDADLWTIVETINTHSTALRQQVAAEPAEPEAGFLVRGDAPEPPNPRQKGPFDKLVPRDRVDEIIARAEKAEAELKDAIARAELAETRARNANLFLFQATTKLEKAEADGARLLDALWKRVSACPNCEGNGIGWPIPCEACGMHEGHPDAVLIKGLEVKPCAN